jgi:hypothetical protein
MTAFDAGRAADSAASTPRGALLDHSDKSRPKKTFRGRAPPRRALCLALAIGMTPAAAQTVSYICDNTCTGGITGLTYANNTYCQDNGPGAVGGESAGKRFEPLAQATKSLLGARARPFR